VKGQRPATLVILAAGQAKRYGGGLKPLAPVGPDGEAILDLVASDAVGAGFSSLVVVVSPSTGPTIRAHIERHWPADVDITFAVQESPRGTVDAVLSAWGALEGAGHFGVANADDLYGPGALAILSGHVTGADTESALVGFRLANAVVGSSPVTRGICQVDPEGVLARIDERRGVTRRQDGTFVTADGGSPDVLPADALVSMNLWAFSVELEGVFRAAMDRAGDDEVLLPELVGRIIGCAEPAQRFRVLPTDSRCVGVTHPDDLALVQADVAEQIRRGERPPRPWAHS
jgi:hypothetical protein